MEITAKELLERAPLDRAEVLCGAERLSGRAVSGVTVIHWPAAAFARPRELVLTTGVGCPRSRLPAFIGELADRDVAALAFSSPFDAELPGEVVDAADRRGLPLLQLPWELAFADVTRGVIERLVADRVGADGLYGRFTRAMLDGTGCAGIAQELEACSGRPALIFDVDFKLVAHGQLAVAALGAGALAELGSAADALGEAEHAELAALLRLEAPIGLPALPGLGVGTGEGLAARARRRAVGFVYLLAAARRADDGCGGLPRPLAARALAHAADATAIELLRNRTAAEDAMQARDDLLGEIVGGALTDPGAIAARARAAGIDPDAPHELALVRAGGEAPAVVDLLRQRARRRCMSLAVCERGDTAVLVAPAAPEPSFGLRALVAAVAADQAGADVRWALADAPCALAQLPRACEEARCAQRVGASVQPEAPIADARTLAPYMMLGVLGRDAHATRVARAIVGPLAAYDERTGRNLLETLEVYLEEQGNTSSAARRLFLNRHSLLYRLRKIEGLTGQSLERAPERFLMELSLKLHRFGALDAREADAGAPSTELAVP